MLKIIRTLALGATITTLTVASAQSQDHDLKPTIVLVHGAFAESSSWDAVSTRLTKDGYVTIAAANPLRSVVSDAASVAALVRTIDGPVVLVGHSYGGPVITEAANGNPNVKALVYVAGFMPDTGESSLTLSGKFPGSTLASALAPVMLPDGTQDLYIQPSKFHLQFAADVSDDKAALMASAQRPVAQAALVEPSGAASWKMLPSYMIYGSADRNIPPPVMQFMAERAQAAKTVVVDGASHALMVSHPGEVTALIEEAASAR
ncbi:alpha/beta fold hydrolase [Rhizobium rhizogenes]|jgi:pimeloyl-ACP methyl ester carboxylesterase|uniref:alpha/beta fold hydrolase n=1 Tax=Rhizobium rhizogenes TaxID=359 RepID=UPI00080FF7DC|nr:alpha/beta hydrolase [Rhizobium rhizogenes]OCJ22388.1 alpha/beta hydrolase [Agrobacterium sp. B131/95]NTF62837.1 alpha/beta hydrolase [Rhizobium rhizogenes]NTF69482.1 alpha/beta hydrolase [Rhizobium rhizogenes]NTG01730.1 alpha/beta hydrolase [Rhizobium rhizogenes]NTG61696.1 alpha/beta hydrolase [Rhizobium rhizogenes]